jgi:hypothetical protein
MTPRYCTARWLCGHQRNAATTARDGRCRSCLAHRMRENRKLSRKERTPKTHYICGHPKADNSTTEKHPRCLICHRARQVRSYTTFKCGHDVVAENIVMRGPFRRCKQCLPVQEKPSLKPPIFPCGHPRESSNFAPNGPGKVRCYECFRSRMEAYRREQYCASPPAPRLVDSWRPLPILNTSGRSYGGCGAFPLKTVRSA